MKTERIFGVLVLALALGACGADEGDGGDVDVAATDSAMAPVAEGAAVADTATSMASQVTMAQVNGSGVEGMAMVVSTGSEVQVNVQVTGLSEGGHAGHIHSGTCAAPGPPVVPLQPITAASDGMGNTTSTVAIDAMTLMNGQHLIQYHSGPDGGPGVTCGDIPAHTM